MTPDEMQEKAEVLHAIIEANPSQATDAVLPSATLLLVGAEICRRLDDLVIEMRIHRGSYDQ